VIPKYANTKFANTSPAAHITTKKAQITRVKDEVKFLYKKGKKKETQPRALQSTSEGGAKVGGGGDVGAHP
jgi:purine nucleoside phosphorylase